MANSNAALVTIIGMAFNEADRNLVDMTFVIKANGDVSPELSGTVTYPKAATTATKQNAVRDYVNAQLGAREPAFVNLTNAVIQISGLPV